MKGCFSVARIFSATRREMMSDGPPGGKALTIFTGPEGNVESARAAAATRGATLAAAPRRSRRRVCGRRIAGCMSAGKKVHRSSGPPAAFALPRGAAPVYMNEPGAGRTGWLAGLGGRSVGAALNALHARPAHAWTLQELAREAGSSRSVLAERFWHLARNSPMQYL